MKLRCACDEDFVYDHTKAGQPFKCRWCGQLIVMPQFEALSLEDQSLYRNELTKKREKAERAAKKAEHKKQLAAAKEAARLERVKQEALEIERRNEEAKRQQATRAEEERQYAHALAYAKSEPNKPKTWFCSISGSRHGPMQEAMVQKWIDDGMLGQADCVCVEGSATWIRLSDIPERFHVSSIPETGPVRNIVSASRNGYSTQPFSV